MEGSPRPIGGHDKARRISGVTAPPGWLHRVCFEEGLEAHFLFDIATRGVVDANKSAEQLSGYSREELLELRLDDLHPRGSREKTISYFEKIKQHGSYMYDDLPLETREQQRVPVEVKGALLGFGGGRIVQAMFRDVRKERQLQQEVLFQELKLTMLQSLSSAISDSLDLTEMLSDALAAVMETSGGLYGEMLLWLEDSGTFQIVSHQGDNVTLPETRLPLGARPMAAPALNGQPVLLDSLDADPRLARLLSACQGIAAVAAVPLRSKSRVVGVMHLGISERQPFPTLDFDFFTSIGNQIGMAAEHALLVQRSSAPTKQITVLHNIARIISSSLHLQAVVDSF